MTRTVPKDHLWSIPPGTKASKCTGPTCGATIYWIYTVAGKKMPVNEPTSQDFEGYGLGIAHWATCPGRDRFRKPR